MRLSVTYIWIIISWGFIQFHWIVSEMLANKCPHFRRVVAFLIPLYVKSLHVSVRILCSRLAIHLKFSQNSTMIWILCISMNMDRTQYHKQKKPKIGVSGNRYFRRTVVCILHNICKKLQIVDSSVPMLWTDDDITHQQQDDSDNSHRVGNAVRQHYIDKCIWCFVYEMQTQSFLDVAVIG